MLFTVTCFITVLWQALDVLCDANSAVFCVNSAKFFDVVL